MTLEITFTHIIIAIVVAFIMGLAFGYLISKLRNTAIQAVGPADDSRHGWSIPTGRPDESSARQVSDEAIDIGAKELMAMAEAQGYHMTEAEARQQAEDMLNEGMGITIDDAPTR